MPCTSVGRAAEREIKGLTHWLRMRTRVVHCEPFGQGGVVEGLVGGNEGDAAHSGGEPSAVQFQGGGQLHGVISPQ